MSVFDRLFGTKKAQPTQQPAVSAERSGPQSTIKTAQPSQPSAGQPATQQPPPTPSRPPDTSAKPDLAQQLVEGMQKVTELEVKLGKYYQAHSISANEMFVQVALNLSAHNLALLNLLRLPQSSFNDVEIKNQITQFESAGEVPGIGPSPLISQLNEILQRPELISTPEGRARAELVYSRRLRAVLNMYFEVGSKLLVKADMEAKGLPAGFIARAMETYDGEKIWPFPQESQKAAPPPSGSVPAPHPTVSADAKRAKADGETVKCGSCGKPLTVKYHEAGKQVFASREAMQSLALRCQDCGFIVCGQCTTPTSGEGGAVCPACRKVGGPYPFTREVELARKKADDIIASAPRLDVKQPDLFVKLLNELITLVKKDNSGFANKPRIREIGEELNRQGGMKQMQQAFYLVRNTGAYFSQDIWDGIGEWRE